MVDQHLETGAGVTVAAIRQPITLADQFGVIELDPSDSRKIGRFREKPTDAVGLPDAPNEVLASMGNYVFDADVLVDAGSRTTTSRGAGTTWVAISCPLRRPGMPGTSTTSKTTRCPGPPTATGLLA